MAEVMLDASKTDCELQDKKMCRGVDRMVNDTSNCASRKE